MKKGLLIGTLGAAALLVGGTFAAYFVNDAADQKTATIKIKDLIDDEFVTLEWGTDTLQDVEELAPGAEAKVGNVTVKASGKDAEGQEIDADHPYVGYLDLVLDNDLKGHLSVFAKLVQGEEEVAAEGTAITGGMRYEAAVYPEGDKTYAVYVKLDTLGEIGEDLAYVSQGEAALSIDWNMGAESTPAEVEEETVYFLVGKINGAEADWSVNPTGKMHFGEPNEADKAENVACLYNVELKAEDEIKVIEMTGETVTWHGAGEDNVVIAEDGAYNLYLSKDGNLYKAKIEAEPQDPEEPETVYFLVGKINGAEEDWSTTPEGKTLFVEPKDEDKEQNLACLYNVELKAADEIKVIELTGETVTWHGNGDDNVVIAADGEYNLYLSKDGNLYAAKIGAEPEEPEAAKYYLVGVVAAYEGIGWSVETGVLMDGEPGENKAAMFNVTLAVGDKFKVVGEDNTWYNPDPTLGNQEYVSIDGDGNAKMDAAGAYDIYLNGDGQIWVAVHAGE